jgi:hypothetical protein
MHLLTSKNESNRRREENTPLHSTTTTTTMHTHRAVLVPGLPTSESSRRRGEENTPTTTTTTMTADVSTTNDVARQRRRRIGFAVLAAVCVVVGALAIGFAHQDQGKDQSEPVATTTGGGIAPMADVTTKTEGVPAVLEEPGKSNAAGGTASGLPHPPCI